METCVSNSVERYRLHNILLEKKRKTTQAVKTLPASIKEKRIPMAEASCIPSTKEKRKDKWGSGGLLAGPRA
eukprot:1162073-Pelagomonas_calceolata.AAC.5